MLEATMYRILMPIDIGKEEMREQVEAVVGLPQGGTTVHVDVLHVYEEVDTPADEAGKTYIEMVNDNIDDLRDLPDSVTAAVEALDEAGIETAVHGVAGKPAAKILEAAEEHDNDMIVVGTKRRRPIGKAVFGSVAQTVLLDSKRPVVVTTA